MKKLLIKVFKKISPAVFIFLLAGSNAAAKNSSLSLQEISEYLKDHTFKLEKEWEQHLASSLSIDRGIKYTWFGVNITLDQDALLKSSEIRGILSRKTANLPGLSSQDSDLQETQVKTYISDAFFLKFVTAIRVRVESGQDALSFHSREVNELVTNQFPLELQKKVTIRINKSALFSTIAKDEKKLDLAPSEVQKPQKIEKIEKVEKVEKAEKIEKIEYPREILQTLSMPPWIESSLKKAGSSLVRLTLAGLGAVFLLFLILLWQLGRGAKIIARALGTIGGMSNSPEIDRSPVNVSKALESQSPQSSDNESFVSVINEIKSFLSQRPDLGCDLLKHFILSRQHEDALLVLGSIPPQSQIEAFNSCSKNHQVSFHNFVRNHGYGFFQNDLKLIESAKNIYKIAFLAAQDPGCLTLRSLKTILLEQNEVKFNEIVGKLSESDQVTALALSMPGRVASFIRSGIKAEKIIQKLAVTTIDDNMLKNLFNVLTAGNELVVNNQEPIKRIKDIANYLPSSVEAAFYQLAGVAKRKSFSQVYSENRSFAHSWVLALTFKAQKDLLGVLEYNEVQDLLQILPPIKARRLLGSKLAATSEGYLLKTQLSEFLRSKEGLVKPRTDGNQFMDEVA